MTKRFILGFVGLIICIFSSSKIILADDIKMAIGLALPPYVISESNSGIELDSVTHILASQGYTIKPKYVNFGSVARQIKNGKVDGALTITEASGITDIFYSDYHVTYQNVAISLKKKGLSINKIEDLQKYRILAFQDATKYLGDVYATTVKNVPIYREIAKQEVQIARLFAEKTDVLIIDVNIFKYFRLHNKKRDMSLEIQIHQVFPPSRYKVGFSNQVIRDKFNVGLKDFQAKGVYEKIYRRYITD